MVFSYFINSLVLALLLIQPYTLLPSLFVNCYVTLLKLSEFPLLFIEALLLVRLTRKVGEKFVDLINESEEKSSIWKAVVLLYSFFIYGLSLIILKNGLQNADSEIYSQ